MSANSNLSMTGQDTVQNKGNVSAVPVTSLRSTIRLECMPVSTKTLILSCSNGCESVLEKYHTEIHAFRTNHVLLV